MNTKSTVLLLVVALLLGGYFLVFETNLFGLKQGDTHHPADQSPTPATGRPLFDPAFLAEDINSLTIEKPGGPTLVLQRHGNQWFQTQPVVFPLAGWSIDSLLGKAADLRYTNVIDPAAQSIEPATLGLEPPRATIRLEGRTKASGPDQPARDFSHTVRLGRTVAAGRAYLQLAGDDKRVFVVNDGLHKAALNQSINEWRSKTLNTASADQVRSITLTRPDLTIGLVHQDGRWRMTRPATGRADSDQVEQLINAIQLASIDSFTADAPEDLARFGLDKPSRSLTIIRHQPDPAPDDKDNGKDKGKDHKAAPPTDRLVIGRQADVAGEKFYAMYSRQPDWPQGKPVVFTLRKTDVEKLDVAPLELRSRKLVELDRSLIQQLTLTQPDGRTLAFKREKDRWVFAHSPAPAFPPDAQVVDELLDALLNTESTDGKLLEQSTLPDPLTTVTIDLGDAEKPKLLVHRGDKSCQVLLAGETIASIAPTDKLQPLFADALYYRNRNAWDLKADQVKALAISRKTDHPAEYRFEKDKDQWKLDGFDQSRFNRLLDQLTPLRVEKWHPEDLPAETRTITVTLTTTDDKTMTLTVLPDHENQASATGCDMNFLVSDDLVDLLESELRNTTAIDLTIDKLAKVQTEGWTVERDANGVYTISGDLDLDESKAGTLFDTLAGLQVEYWLEPGAVQGPPTHRLTLTERDQNRQHVLQLWIPDDWSKGKARGRVDDGQPFELLRDTAEKLIASPIKEPEK